MKILTPKQTETINSVIADLHHAKKKLNEVLSENDAFRQHDTGIRIDRNLTGVIWGLELTVFKDTEDLNQTTGSKLKLASHLENGDVLQIASTKEKRKVTAIENLAGVVVITLGDFEFAVTKNTMLEVFN